MNLNSPAITIAKTLLKVNNAFEDDLFVVLGTIAEEDALAYTKNEQVLFEYGILGRMIQYSYNQLGIEGLSSQSIATISETYTASTTPYPQSILSALKGFTKLKTL